MTLDEAIKKYENIAKYHADPYSNGDWHYTNKIMAEDYSQLAEWLKELKRLREHTDVPNKNVGDLISRQDAIEVVQKWFDRIKLNGDICLDGLRSLPSVEPERKFIENVLETLREMDDAVDVICNLDVDAVLDRIEVEETR